MCDRNTIIHKIRKLLALSTSSNPHEAARALEKAIALMGQHGLSETDVEIVRAPAGAPVKRASIWRWRIASAAAWCNGVIAVNDTAGWTFCGDEIGVAVSVEMYEYCEKTIMRITRNTVRKNAKAKYRESFRLGMATEISARLRDYAAKSSWRGDRESRIGRVEEAMARELETVEGKRKALKGQAFTQGLVAGARVGLSKQVYGDEPKARIAGGPHG